MSTDSSWPYDTGEFIALAVPEESARTRMQSRVNDLRDTITEMATYLHTKYHLNDESNTAKTWESCDHRICKQARRTLNTEQEPEL